MAGSREGRGRWRAGGSTDDGRRELMAAGCVKKRGEDNVRREIYIKITIHIRV
jgi:hypothetical protein